MVSFTKTDNTVEVNFSDKEKHFISAESTVQGRVGDAFVIVAEILQGGNSGRKYQIEVLEINARPSDDPLVVAEWLRDNFFSGLAIATGGGGGGDASAANQLTQIARADTLISDLDDFQAKTPSGFVNVNFDEKVIVYSDAANGVIDYIQYKNLGAEVERETFSYDGFGNVTGVI